MGDGNIKSYRAPYCGIMNPVNKHLVILLYVGNWVKSADADFYVVVPYVIDNSFKEMILLQDL